ncbi:rRNA methyltransferase 1, mitochondrial [Bombina bombina]|uniref:rRNA methyltransferase 1, mitochondrial n=1 Tax=Bombina bombina TaxID=8345 RepID=UPI00235B06DA|nr:rRNA methyltransferase 1, mitochondrial [Bombina bombina]XP_053562791.1 rRNA methyltransferase 1, mitochondrial [Bombina bombina]
MIPVGITRYHQQILQKIQLDWRHYLAVVRYFTTKDSSPSLLLSDDYMGLKKEKSNQVNAKEHVDTEYPYQEPPKSTKSPRDRKSFFSKKSAQFVNDGSNPSQESVRSEFRKLRDDDFSKYNRKSVSGRKVFERSKGSEILFGVAPCYLALTKCRRNILQLFLKSTRSQQRSEIQEICQKAEAAGLHVNFVSRKSLDGLCEGRVHQGVCLEVTPLKYSDYIENECISQDKHVLYLALHGVYDPMNLGAVLRSAYFLGVNKVVVSKKNSCSLTPVVSKASAGVMEVFEVFGIEDLAAFLQEKLEKGWKVLGTVKPSEDCEVPVYSVSQYQINSSSVLLLGNEGYGLPTELKHLCSSMLTIPSANVLQPGIDSLNISVAAGILLHSLCSQRT